MFGAVSSPSHKVQGYSSPIVALRKAMDLYANVRPVISNSINMLIIRENTECLYVKKEYEKMTDKGRVAIAERHISEYASRRIARLALDECMKRSKNGSIKPKLTVVHKANVLSITDGLFRESVLDECKNYPLVKVEEQLVDSMIYKLYKDPKSFDVIVAPNMYGDIVRYFYFVF
jgi:homoisocitrate dehydrogenase